MRKKSLIFKGVGYTLTLVPGPKVGDSLLNSLSFYFISRTFHSKIFDNPLKGFKDEPLGNIFPKSYLWSFWPLKKIICPILASLFNIVGTLFSKHTQGEWLTILYGTNDQNLARKIFQTCDIWADM
jgi:hypothetical protein